MFEKSFHRMSLIQSWIIYIGGLGGGGAGGCKTTTGSSCSIFPISLGVTSRLSGIGGGGGTGLQTGTGLSVSIFPIPVTV